MNRHLVLALLLLVPAAMAKPAAAQSAIALPPACVAEAPADAHAGHGMPASGGGEMHAAMTLAAAIPDPDLAFNCGMIVHHQGAIQMAETELRDGKDDASRKLAEMIIAAQKQEIAEMTAWVEAHTR
jgi:uncharacterized protein (DUF305 family)